MLEVKSPSIEPRASGSGETKRSSRPSSPAISQPAPAPTLIAAAAPVSVAMDVSNPPSSEPMRSQNSSGPSAVSRLFGRFRRNASNTGPDIDENDLQLSADDFSFLQEVPSLSTPEPVGDLLSLESGRTEEIAGLESMLNSKVTPLPATLAPPPLMSRRSASAGGIVPGTGKPGGFVAKMRTASTDMDLLGGLDFTDSPTEPAKTTSIGSMWDDFLQSSQPANPTQAPSSIQQVRTSSAPLQPVQSTSQPSQPSQNMSIDAFEDFMSPTKAAPSRLIPTTLPSATQQPSMPMTLTGFDDFASPQKAGPSNSTSFDDFGDFSTFADSSRAAAPPTSSPQTSSRKANLALSPSAAHSRVSSVDHSSTMSLMSDAAALKGRRWPAPPSPAAPNLEPPPRSVSSGGFPFLTPPPLPRPASGAGRVNLLDAEPDIPRSTMTPPPRTTMSPPRLATPPINAQPMKNGTPAVAAPAMKSSGLSLSAGKGLTAQDLSFFDSL